jgi:hypothetical protein
MSKESQRIRRFLIHNLEAFIWLAVIIYFAASPVQFGNHFTICPLSLAGFEHCPGCGLGRSMVLLLHGRVAESISMHPLGIFALGMFTVRILTVFNNYFNLQKHLPVNEQVKQ